MKMTDRFAEFSHRNRERCEAPNGFNHPLDGWSTSDWMTATLGELGEAANIIKKLNRIRDGLGDRNRKGEEAPMLRIELARELADTFTYLDLLAQSLGLDLLDEAEAKFDEISQAIGYVEGRRPSTEELEIDLFSTGGSDR